MLDPDFEPLGPSSVAGCYSLDGKSKSEVSLLSGRLIYAHSRLKMECCLEVRSLIGWFAALLGEVWLPLRPFFLLSSYSGGLANLQLGCLTLGSFLLCRGLP